MTDQNKHNPETRIKATDPVFTPVITAMYALEGPMRKSTLEPALRELVKTRASQINGCAFCLDMHTKDARAQGETEQRLYGLNAWRETPFYTDRERAALEWTEQLTLIAGKGVPDDLYRRVKGQFTDEELVLLTLAVVQINAYNRFAIPFRPEIGSYQPAQRDVTPAGATQ